MRKRKTPEQRKRANARFIEKKKKRALAKLKSKDVAAKVLEAFFNRLKELHFPMPNEVEYKFHPDRNWHFDFAWTDISYISSDAGLCDSFHRIKIAMEIEGRGRHQSMKGYTADCQKYNAASADGWIVLRATYSMLRNDEFIIDLFDTLRLRGAII